VPTDLERLESLEQSIANLSPERIGEALDRAIAQSAPAPAARLAATPPSPAEPVDRVELAIQKLDGYADEVESRDPSALEYHLMGTRAVEAAAALRQVVHDPVSSMEDRLVARETFAHAWQSDAEGRARRTREYHAAQQAQADARASEAAQARVEAAEMTRREMGQVAERLSFASGGERFALAVESGAVDASDEQLRGAGWSRGQIALVHDLRQRVVQVEPSKLAGLGHQTFSNARGTFAYVPAGEDVASFRARFG
jgi:hypothetical protein